MELGLAQASLTLFAFRFLGYADMLVRVIDFFPFFFCFRFNFWGQNYRLISYWIKNGFFFFFLNKKMDSFFSCVVNLFSRMKKNIKLGNNERNSEKPPHSVISYVIKY